MRALLPISLLGIGFSSLLLLQVPQVVAVESSIKTTNEKTVIRSIDNDDDNSEKKKTSLEKRSTIKTTNETIRKEQLEETTRLKTAAEKKIQEVRSQVQMEVAKRHALRLERHFAQYEERLSNIAARIQTRIDKQKANGNDVNSSQTKLNEAKTILASAIANGKVTVAAFMAITPLDWESHKENSKAAQDLASKTRREFIEAHKHMVEAVQALYTE